MKRIILIAMLVMVFSLAGMRSSVLAVDDKDSRETLKGLNGIYVFVVDLNPDIKQAGLSESQIQNDVELKLRLAGVRVLTQEEFFKGKVAPSAMLSMNVSATKRKEYGMFLVGVSCEVYQYVFLERDPSIKLSVPTWREYAFGIDDIKGIRAQIKDQVDIFINAYLSVNPKK